MQHQDIFNKLVVIIVDQIAVEPEDITEDTSLRDDLEADSLDMLQIVTAIEDEFDIEVDDSVFEDVQTIGDATDYIQSQI